MTMETSDILWILSTTVNWMVNHKRNYQASLIFAFHQGKDLLEMHVLCQDDGKILTYTFDKKGTSYDYFEQKRDIQVDDFLKSIDHQHVNEMFIRIFDGTTCGYSANNVYQIYPTASDFSLPLPVPFRSLGEELIDPRDPWTRCFP